MYIKTNHKITLPTHACTVFSSRLYLCARKNPYALHPVSQKFLQRRLRNGLIVCLIDDDSLSSFQGRSSNASSFHASLLQVIDGVMSLALCPQLVCLKFLSTLDLPRSKPLVRVALPASLSARSFPFTPACPGQYIHRSFRRLISNVDRFQSGFPISVFTFCSKLIESVRMVACVV